MSNDPEGGAQEFESCEGSYHGRQGRSSAPSSTADPGSGALGDSLDRPQIDGELPGVHRSIHLQVVPERSPTGPTASGPLDHDHGAGTALRQGVAKGRLPPEERPTRQRGPARMAERGGHGDHPQARLAETLELSHRQLGVIDLGHDHDRGAVLPPPVGGPLDETERDARPNREDDAHEHVDGHDPA